MSPLCIQNDDYCPEPPSGKVADYKPQLKILFIFFAITKTWKNMEVISTFL